MDRTVTQRVASNLRAEVARKRVPQTVLAERTGLSQQGVSRRLLGQVAIDVDELARFAEILDVPLDSLLGGTAVIGATA